MPPIETLVPNTLRTPGSFHQFKFDGSGNQLVTFDVNVAIVAEKSAAGTAPADAPIEVFDETDADTKCGKGSLAALGYRKTLEQLKLMGLTVGPRIYVVPLAEPGAGTAAQYTLTFAGPATAAGDVVTTVAGRTVQIGVSAGDSANAIAAAYKAELDRLKAILPVTAAVVGAVVTITFVTKGVNGNDVERTTIKLPAGVGLVHAASVAGAGATAIAAALGALYDREYQGIVLANHVAGDAATILADAALGWGFGQKNYRFFGIGERGSLGTAQTLQDSFNDYRVLIFSCEATGSLPVEIASAAMVSWLAKEAPNANLNSQRLALFPPPAASAYTASEVESALADGVTPLVPDGPFVKIVRLVTTQITSGGAPFEPLRDAQYPRTAAAMARQVDAGFIGGGFVQEVLYTSTDGDDPLTRIRDMTVEKHRAAEKSRWIRDVDSFLPQIQAVIAGAPPGRVIIANPFRVAGPLHQGVFVHVMYQ